MRRVMYMSNIGTVKIPSDGSYHDIETLLGTSFEEGKLYTIQVDGDVKICESAEEPTAGGFRINFTEPFQLDYDGTSKLWAKALSFVKGSYVTVAD